MVGLYSDMCVCYQRKSLNFLWPSDSSDRRSAMRNVAVGGKDRITNRSYCFFIKARMKYVTLTRRSQKPISRNGGTQLFSQHGAQRRDRLPRATWRRHRQSFVLSSGRLYWRDMIWVSLLWQLLIKRAALRIGRAWCFCTTVRGETAASSVSVAINQLRATDTLPEVCASLQCQVSSHFASRQYKTKETTAASGKQWIEGHE